MRDTGKVYLVQHRRPNGENGGVYALKCMKKKVIVDSGFVEAVVAEKQALVDLSHPFIGHTILLLPLNSFYAPS